VPDKAFENILALFQRYSWNLNDTPGGDDNEINPDVLGYIFEKYINQKAFGAYYTRTEITEYLCGRSIHRLILNAVNTPEVAKAHPIAGAKIRDYQTIADLLMDLDAPLCRELLFDVLPNLSLLDPACGSGAFLVAAMKVLINVYSAVIGKIKFLGQRSLTDWLSRVEHEHKSLNYFIKKTIVTDNLYGVDIMEEATEIAKLRLFLALVAAAESVDPFYRSAAQYKNQISLVNGKKAGSDINLYKLFTEQCFNLLRNGGECGIVIPSGIYTDLGTKQLRELLFTQAKITGLFGFENRKEIFEGVHRSYKFVVFTFERAGHTESFPAAFMRFDAEELERFPQHGAIAISVDLIRKLSPDSLSVMEFKSDTDLRISEKMTHFPLLSEHQEGIWNIRLAREFDMTNDSDLFKTTPAANRLPLYEGKMIWQFDHHCAEPRFWIDERQGRRALLGRGNDDGRTLDYQSYRVGFRSAGENTNECNFISAIVPRGNFCGNSIIFATELGQHLRLQLFLCAFFNSFVLDYAVRLRISRNMNMFYIYQLPIPRHTDADPSFKPIVERAAKLICMAHEFDQLAQEAGLGSHKAGATDPAERARLRSELDGLVAHVYGLTEEDFAHILTTFPLVEASVKEAALAAYKAFAPKSADQEVAAMIAGGENATVEFKSSARWDLKQDTQNKAMEHVIVKTVAAFLNTDGGTLLIGVDDSATVSGLQNDYKTLGKHQDRDGYESWLTTLLLDQFGKESSPLIRITFHDMAGQDVCRLAVKPSPKAVYVTEGNAENLYIRTGNATRQLTTKEAIDYSKHRWK
jgi:Schlafen, AlbA_2/MmeI, DNA-methyltransferase domain